MRAIALLLLVAAVLVQPVAAQPIEFAGSIRLRGEAWSWFEASGYEDDYTFLGSIIRASASQKRARSAWQVELAQPTLIDLPDAATAPAPRGQLGLGASYFAANGAQNPAGLFVKQAWFRLDRGTASLRIGRFEFNEGTEVAPKDAALAAIKQQRIAARLIGTFAFSHVGRSFDGVHATWGRAPLQATRVAARPTAGAFRVDGGSTLGDVGLMYGSITRSVASADMRLFAIVYRDDRGLLKADNRPLAARTMDRSDIDVVTLGGHYVRLVGKNDVLLWGALQTGDWGTLDHSAYAFAVEAGRRWESASLRGGMYLGSGDCDPADGDHDTFLQILPTPRMYARFPFYNAMNGRDLYLIGAWRATPSLRVTSEIHRLRLATLSDLWYAGGGAFEETSFGFAGRPSNGSRDLATVIDVGAELGIGKKTSVGAYIGLASGGDVIDAIYAGNEGRYAYLEVIRRF
ncbi:MAG TPA: alginate export family protein [Thermoanaerobaculia bacterium]